MGTVFSLWLVTSLLRWDFPKNSIQCSWIMGFSGLLKTGALPGSGWMLSIVSSYLFLQFFPSLGEVMCLYVLFSAQVNTLKDLLKAPRGTQSQCSSLLPGTQLWETLATLISQDAQLWLFKKRSPLSFTRDHSPHSGLENFSRWWAGTISQGWPGLLPICWVSSLPGVQCLENHYFV